MAQPQDIRRNVGDVSPNNFIQPGVQDTSVADTVGKLGEIGMAVDSQVAQIKFGEAVESLRTQYLTGKTPQEVASVVDEPAVDPDADYVPTAEDNRALADFGKVLDQHQQAVSQGVRSQDMFRMSAERLYRIAISKRPGLAREFRGVAERFLGFDVVGASVAYEAQQDEAYIKSLADASKSKAEKESDFIKRQREVWEKVYPQSAFVPDEQWAAYTASKMEEFMAVTGKATAAQVAKNEIDLLDFQGKRSAEADERYYISQMDVINANYGSAIEKAMTAAATPDENGVKLIDSPAGMRQVVQGLRTALLGEVAKVDQAVAGRNVSGDTKARYRSLTDQTLTKIDNVLNLKDDQEFMERANTLLRAEAQRKILSNEDARMFAAIDAEYGDVIMDRVIQANGKTVALTAAQLLTDNLSPNMATKVATRSLSQVIGAVWPQGSQTPPDPVATSKAAEDIAKTLSKFYLQDDSNFHPADFTAWEGKEGILPMLTKRAPVIRKSLSDEESGQITAQIAAASGNSALRLLSLLQKKSPGLVAKLDFDSVWKPDTAGLIAPKAGAKLSPTEQQILNHFGKQFNRDVITKAILAYGGGSPAESWTYIASQVKPMEDVKAQARGAAIAQSAAQTLQNATGEASGQGAGRGVQGGASGPAVGTVEDGYEYVGGDPSSPSSWKRVQ